MKITIISLLINQKYNFVDPETGTHTNNIERECRDIRNMVQAMDGNVG